MDRNVIRYGSTRPLPERRSLAAGPYSLYFENGDIRRITLAGREVIRRVYVAVRDRNWGTVPGVISDLEIEEGNGVFAISFDCLAKREEVAFGWHCDVRGTAEGTITYSMAGAAKAGFLSNRIGICVLHPIDGCAGRRCRVGLADGTDLEGTFPLFISPHQPFTDVRAIQHEVAPGLWNEVSFEGAVFEMEDQRNWSDASYKTYSGVLREPYPFQVRTGQEVNQSVTIRPRGERVPSRRPPAADAHVCVSVGREPIGVMPRLGLGLSERRAEPGDIELERLRSLRLSHLRVDLRLGQPGWQSPLDRASRVAAAVGARLEVAVTLGDDEERDLFELARHLPELGDTVVRWLVFHEGEDCTSDRWLRLARRELAASLPGAWIGGGSNVYFTELNRGQAPVAAADFVCFPFTPQVHAFDATSIVETLAGQAWSVASARRLCGGLPLVVSPITLRPRVWPGGKGAERRAAAGALPPDVDARQMSLFGAAWTVASLKQLAEGGVHSATYYETAGWRGVMESEEGSPAPEAFPSLPGAVYPMYHVFAACRDAADAVTIPTASGDPERAQALAFRAGGRTRLLLANLTPEPQRVSLSGLSESLNLRTLDEHCAEAAMADPDGFLREPPQTLEVAGATTLRLLPYAVAIVDGL